MVNRQDNILSIRTPEGVEFSLTLAGPIIRFLAWLIDGLCIAGTLTIGGSLLKILSAISVDFGMAVYTLIGFLVSIGYAIFFEWRWAGQTPGKRILNLRVMDRKGLKLQFSQVMVRNLLRVVDSLPYFYMVGGIACLVNRNAQRLGDLSAHTIVVRTPKVIIPDIDKLFPDKYNSLREHPHLAARLRQNLAASDAALGLQSLIRRNELDATARVALFEELASHYRSVVLFPEQATDGLSDERYVRNVVDVIYRPRTGPKD